METKAIMETKVITDVFALNIYTKQKKALEKRKELENIEQQLFTYIKNQKRTSSYEIKNIDNLNSEIKSKYRELEEVQIEVSFLKYIAVQLDILEEVEKKAIELKVFLDN